MDEQVKESLWYMTIALEEHYKGASEEANAKKFIRLLRKILRLETPCNGGGVGMCQGWLEEILEAENQLKT